MAVHSLKVFWNVEEAWHGQLLFEEFNALKQSQGSVDSDVTHQDVTDTGDTGSYKAKFENFLNLVIRI
jgi:hypothetical protein